MKTLLFLIALLMLPFSGRGQYGDTLYDMSIDTSRSISPPQDALSPDSSIQHTVPKYAPSQECDTTGWEPLFKKRYILCNPPDDSTLVALYCLKYIKVDSTPIVECHDILPKLEVYYGSLIEDSLVHYLTAAEYSAIKELIALLPTLKEQSKWWQDGAEVESIPFDTFYWVPFNMDDSLMVGCVSQRYRAVRVEP